MSNLFPFEPQPTKPTGWALFGSAIMSAVLNGLCGGITLAIVALFVKVVV